MTWLKNNKFKIIFFLSICLSVFIFTNHKGQKNIITENIQYNDEITSLDSSNELPLKLNNIKLEVQNNTNVADTRNKVINNNGNDLKSTFNLIISELPVISDPKDLSKEHLELYSKTAKKTHALFLENQTEFTDTYFEFIREKKLSSNTSASYLLADIILTSHDDPRYLHDRILNEIRYLQDIENDSAIQNLLDRQLSSLPEDLDKPDEALEKIEQLQSLNLKAFNETIEYKTNHLLQLSENPFNFED